jgi:hypothetical protein
MKSEAELEASTEPEVVEGRKVIERRHSNHIPFEGRELPLGKTLLAAGIIVPSDNYSSDRLSIDELLEEMKRLH